MRVGGRGNQRNHPYARNQQPNKSEKDKKGECLITNINDKSKLVEATNRIEFIADSGATEHITNKGFVLHKQADEVIEQLSFENKAVTFEVKENESIDEQKVEEQTERQDIEVIETEIDVPVEIVKPKKRKEVPAPREMPERRAKKEKLMDPNFVYKAKVSEMKIDDVEVHANLAKTNQDPSRYKDALESSERDSWIIAIEHEFLLIKDHQHNPPLPLIVKNHQKYTYLHNLVMKNPGHVSKKSLNLRNAWSYLFQDQFQQINIVLYALYSVWNALSRYLTFRHRFFNHLKKTSYHLALESELVVASF
ncbi:hypothetical protein TKK_0012245 [Trichogramma kaykai]